MKRFAFKMYLKPGFEEEYARRHAAIWPELRRRIAGYQEVEGENNSQDVEAADEITRKWWDYMADIMEVNPDNSPVTVPIEEVLHLD